MNWTRLPRTPRAALWVWTGYWTVLFVLTHIPVHDVGPFRVRHFDKVVHCGVYFVLVWLGGRYLVQSRRASVGWLIGWAGIYMGYALFDEWVQQFVGRSMTLGDWLSDALGIIAATLLWCYRLRSDSSPAPARASGEKPAD